MIFKKQITFVCLFSLVQLAKINPAYSQEVERVDLHFISADTAANIINRIIDSTPPKPPANTQNNNMSKNNAVVDPISPKINIQITNTASSNSPVPGTTEPSPKGSEGANNLALTIEKVPNVLLLRGDQPKRESARRIIALLDLPRPSVKMEMWGIQLTGDNPKKLSEASARIRTQVDQTQVAIKGTFYRLQSFVNLATQNFDKSLFYSLLKEGNFDESFLFGSREYSLNEMITKLIALGDPNDSKDMNSNYPKTSYHANKMLARELSNLFVSNDLYRDNLAIFTKKYRKSIENIDFQKISELNLSEINIPDLGIQPFERFFQLMGVRPLCQISPSNHDQLLCDWVPARYSVKEAFKKFSCVPDSEQELLNCKPKDPKDEEVQTTSNILNSQKPMLDNNCSKIDSYKLYADQNACRLRNQIVNFGVAYKESLISPNSFDPKKLASTADQLNSPLQVTTRAINLDVEKFFIDPLLRRVEKIASGYGGLKYSNVGRATISTINGETSKLRATASNVFDVTPGLTLSEILDNSSKLDSQIAPFFPGSKQLTSLIESFGASLTVPQIIGLIGAFGEQPRILRELYTGVNLTITPTVSRNLRSAELNIDLIIPDPAVQGSIVRTADNVAPTAATFDNENPDKKAFSRVTQQQINTRVYTDAIDFFSFSTFNNQTTMPGQPFVVPIIGNVWKGIFGSIPIFGDLFQFPTGNRKVYNESILMTTTFITPTPYGVANLLDNAKTSNNGSSSPDSSKSFQRNNPGLSLPNLR